MVVEGLCSFISYNFKILFWIKKKNVGFEGLVENCELMLFIVLMIILKWGDDCPSQLVK